jgi:predicted nuclease with RNAse H fold
MAYQPRYGAIEAVALRIVAGVDVGEKGFHAVTLPPQGEPLTFFSRDADAVAGWCRNQGAGLVGVDAPCHWRHLGRVRVAERRLRAGGIHCFVTPSRAVAMRQPFYRWMLAGEKLYRALRRRGYSLVADPARPLQGNLCFETFPHAVACALAGNILRATNKAADRPYLLAREGITTAVLTNLDFVDAALCALAARHLGNRSVRAFGDAEGGFIVVPSGAAFGDGAPEFGAQ